jgi:hypothetical protein
VTPKILQSVVPETGGNAGGAGGGAGGAGAGEALSENKLAVLIVKARMKGDKEGMRKLQEQLDNLRQRKR